MSLSELFPVVSQLSRQDKLRLIHFLLLAVAEEENCQLEINEKETQQEKLLEQLKSTDAAVWSPYDAPDASQTLSKLLMKAKLEDNA